VDVDVLLLILRVAAGGLLLAFWAMVVIVMWRDYRAAAGTVEQFQREQGRLVVIQSSDGSSGLSYPLLPLTSLGRSPSNTVVLDDHFCSQEHALVTRRGGQWWLEDRNSSNGTLLNGEAVVEPVVVSSGDMIRIGQIILKIEL
jgi:hypothetical protein